MIRLAGIAGIATGIATDSLKIYKGIYVFPKKIKIIALFNISRSPN